MKGYLVQSVNEYSNKGDKQNTYTREQPEVKL